MAKNNTNIDRLKKKLVPFFEHQLDVSLAFLFGSVAERRIHQLSDIDIAVFYNKKVSFKRHLQLVNDLTSVLETDNIDVVDMNTASPLILHDIFSFGQLVLCRDDNLYIQMRLKTLRQFDDMTHILKIQGRYIFSRALNV